MVNPIKKLFIVFICLALVACARSPKVIDAESLSFSIAEDISELEVDASLKNIDLHTAIAIAVRNNRDLRISVMESALVKSQKTYKNLICFLTLHLTLVILSLLNFNLQQVKLLTLMAG